jgi:HemY protein
VRGLALDALRGAHDMAQLRSVWLGLDKTEQAMPDLALAAARRGHDMLARRPDMGDDERHAALRDLAAWTDPLWNGFEQLDDGQQRQFVRVVEQGLPALDAAGLARLEQQQRQWPQNPHLQYLAGQACLQRQLWGKAAQLLGQARNGLQDATLLRRTWRSLAVLAEERGDEPAAQAAWKQAALLD